MSWRVPETTNDDGGKDNRNDTGNDYADRDDATIDNNGNMDNQIIMPTIVPIKIMILMMIILYWE